MGRGEISWKSRDAEGERREVYAHRVGKTWRFYARERRYDQWQEVSQPPLEYWLKLLDGVQRRIARRLMRPEEEARVKKIVQELFPGTDLTTGGPME
jgi:hypothetical protein